MVTLFSMPFPEASGVLFSKLGAPGGGKELSSWKHPSVLPVVSEPVSSDRPLWESFGSCDNHSSRVFLPDTPGRMVTRATTAEGALR